MDTKQQIQDLRSQLIKTREGLIPMGVGAQLTSIIKAEFEESIIAKAFFDKPNSKDDTCKCVQMARQMDQWGPDGCDMHRQEIIGQLIDNGIKSARAGTGELARNQISKKAVQWLEEAIRTVRHNEVIMASLREFSSTQPKRDEEDDEEDNEDAESGGGNKEEEVETRPMISESVGKSDHELLSEWPFVWTYHAGGAVGDELRYSIRAVLKWHPEARIYVVGDRPDWYTGECFEKPRLSRRPHQDFKDCFSRILHAAETLPRFIWMMDDVYWIQQFPMSDAITPKYVRHVSQQRYKAWKPKNKWARTRAEAYNWLLENNHPTYDFAAHMPQPIVASTINEMESELHLLENYKNWECIYFNRYYSSSAQDWGRRFLRIIKQRRDISTRNSLLNHTHRNYRGVVENFLRESFPEKSKVEKDD